MLLPSHLRRHPNPPIRDLSNEQLEEEIAYWQAKLNEQTSWGAAAAVASYQLKKCEAEFSRRRAAAAPVLSPSPVAWLHILHLSATIYTRQILFTHEPPWQQPLPKDAWMEIQPLYASPSLTEKPQ